MDKIKAKAKPKTSPGLKSTARKPSQETETVVPTDAAVPSVVVPSLTPSASSSSTARPGASTWSVEQQARNESALGASAEIDKMWKDFQAKFDAMNRQIIDKIAVDLGQKPPGDRDSDEESTEWCDTLQYSTSLAETIYSISFIMRGQ